MTAFKTQQARWAKGLDPDRQKNSAQGIQEQSSVPGEGGGVLSPEREPELSADDCSFHAAHAGHDYPVIWRLVPDAGNRPAALSGLHVFYFQLLFGFAERAFPATLAAHIFISSFPHGSGNRTDTDEHARGD